MKKDKLVARMIGLGTFVLGISILFYVAAPIYSYRLHGGTQYREYLSPVPDNEVMAAESVDYTKVSNWFDVETPHFDVSKVRFYTLSIPKLGIKDATVAIGGEDLEESLIQYPGTALPGKRGNAVIFGHSILPQFFNPKDYLSIFSTLPTLKKGDEVGIRYDGISYKYIVSELFEVRPTDLEILAQNTTDSFVTLITCTPPGDPRRPKRLIVRARLDPFATIGGNAENTLN